MSLSDDCSGAIALSDTKTYSVTNDDLGVDSKVSKTESIDPVMAGLTQATVLTS